MYERHLEVEETLKNKAIEIYTLATAYNNQKTSKINMMDAKDINDWIIATWKPYREKIIANGWDRIRLYQITNIDKAIDAANKILNKK